MEEKTEKHGHTAADNPITSSSPLGHEELETQTAVEQKGDDVVEPQKPRKSNPDVHTIPDQRTNPRHTQFKPNSDDD